MSLLTKLGSGLAGLAAFSAGLGGDPLLVQGPGGNTSIKIGGVLHVKASGLWLAGATAGSFVALELEGVRGRLAGAVGEPALSDLVVGGAAGMRPSIEAGMHAVMPHRVVVHTHSVNALAHLVRVDAEAVLGGVMAGLRWCFVPYARPGMPLLRAIEAAGGVGADVLMLGSHGVVVGAEDVETAGRLVAEVERRVLVAARGVGAGAGLPAWAGWRGAGFAEAHGLGVDGVSRRLAGLGAYYPDHVVFLGAGGVASFVEAAVLGGGAERRVHHGGHGEHGGFRLPVRGVSSFDGVDGRDKPGHDGNTMRSARKMLIVEGAGVMVREGVTAAEEEMVRCLALVLARVPDGVAVRVLDAEEEAALLGWDAEAFRRGLDGRRVEGVG